MGDALYEITITVTNFSGIGWFGIASDGVAQQIPAVTHGHLHGIRIGSSTASSAPIATYDPENDVILEVDSNGDASYTWRIKAQDNKKLDFRVRSSPWNNNFFQTDHPKGDVQIEVKRVRKEVFNGTISNVTVEEVDGLDQARVEIRIENIKDPLPTIDINSSELKYAIDLEDNNDEIIF